MMELLMKTDCGLFMRFAYKNSNWKTAVYFPTEVLLNIDLII